MKKIIGFLALSITFTAITHSCTSEPKKEIIVVPAPPFIIEKEPEKKSTTITVDKNGVKVEAKKIDVTVKKQ